MIFPLEWFAIVIFGFAKQQCVASFLVQLQYPWFLRNYCDVVATAKCWQLKSVCARSRIRKHHNKLVIDNLGAFFIAHIQGHRVSQELHTFLVHLRTRQASTRHKPADLFRWHTNFLRIFRLRQRLLLAISLDAGSKVIASLNIGAFLLECFDRFSPSSFCRHFRWLQSKKLS